MLIRRLFIPACLCLVTVGPTTTGPQAPWPIEAIAASAHAKSKPRRKTTPAAAPAATIGAKPAAEPGNVPKAGLKAKPGAKPRIETLAVLAERFTPFTMDLQASPANQPRAATFAAIAASNAPANPLPPEIVGDFSTPMNPLSDTAPPAHKRVVFRSQREICDTLAKAAQSNNLPVPFFIRLLFQESKFKAGAVSHAGAQGIAQFMPETAADVGLDNPFDPLQAIPAAARLLRDFLDQFGNLGLAAAAYNAGPKRVHRWLKKQSGLPAETRGYVKTITGQPPESWKAAKAGRGSGRLPQHAPCKEVSGLYAFVGTKHIPLPPKPPAPPRATHTPKVSTARTAKKTGPTHGKAVASAEARRGKKTALQLAARRRGEKSLH